MAAHQKVKLPDNSCWQELKGYHTPTHTHTFSLDSDHRLLTDVKTLLNYHYWVDIGQEKEEKSTFKRLNGNYLQKGAFHKYKYISPLIGAN